MYAQHAMVTIGSLGAVLPPFLDNLPWSVIMLDDEGHVIYVNKEMSVRFVADQHPVQGHVREVFPEYYSALRGEVPWLTPQEADFVRQVPEGVAYEHIWLRRLPFGACLIIMDQTRLRELETADAQTARLASLGFMLAGVCHEISNPLTAVYSMVQILQSSGEISSGALEKGLANIAANVKRILDVSRRLVGFSRADDEPRAPFKVDEAVSEALAVLRHDRCFGQIEVECRSDPDALVLGNKGQIQEVLYNIFLNAIQAMRRQGRLGVITHRPAPGRIEVVIRDSGPGIAPELLPRLFEPFFTTKPIGQGTGLGLSISNEIVHEHGGSIAVENNPGNGACFCVQLPLYEKQP
jgi:signal transduction histidine kinase